MKRTTLLAYIAAIIFCTGAAALAPLAGGDFDLSWHTIDGGGGGSSTGGGFELAGTVGQHDAGQTMTGGKFALTGGFWAGVGPATSTPCPWDLSDDGDVGIPDLLILLADWGNPYGIPDLLALLANWGPCP